MKGSFRLPTHRRAALGFFPLIPFYFMIIIVAKFQQRIEM